MNLTYAIFDAAVGVLALRSLGILRRRSPWTSAAWAATAVSAGAAAVRYLNDGPAPVPMFVAEFFFALLTAGFIVGAVRDEAQAEPLLWPVRVGLTRAQRR